MKLYSDKVLQHSDLYLTTQEMTQLQAITGYEPDPDENDSDNEEGN